MRITRVLALAAVAFNIPVAVSYYGLENLDSLEPRALHNFLRQHGLLRRGAAPSTAPSGNYAPSIKQTCPSTLIRQPSAQNSSSGVLSPQEKTWVAGRRANAVSAWASYLNNSALGITQSGFDLQGFLANTSNLPNVGIASGGGGYRAMLHAAGLFNAWDSRNSSSVAQGTGGLLQLATYMVGLSGGSWWTGSLAINDFPMVYDLAKFWNLEENLVDPGGVISLITYYAGLQSQIEEKKHAGQFDLSLTDYWGAALSRHLVNATNGGAATTYSSIQNLTSFAQHQAPFPIIIADSRREGQLAIPSNTSVYEFTPYEFGSWNPSLQAFLPMEYLGTAAVKGKVNGSNGCVVGYDNAGFVMGTSATLFNQIIYNLLSANTTLDTFLGDLLGDLLGKDNDIATYPNPFGGLSPSSYADAGNAELELVDGGEDNEIVPFWPLMLPERNVDVILGLDNSADTTYGWPNGTSIVATAQRMKNPGFAEFARFPQIPPDFATFLNYGLSARPTFFGCNESVSTPLVIYVPNHPYTSYTNFSTFQLGYTAAEVDAFLSNAFHEASMNQTSISNSPSNSALPVSIPSNVPTYPTCLACALISRAERRAGLTQTSVCQSCFQAYCWDGRVNSTDPTNGGKGPWQLNPSIPGVNPATQVGGAGTSATPTPSTDGKNGAGRKFGIESAGLVTGSLAIVLAIFSGSAAILL
ncbi:hypothetical protein DL93DRAFT_2082430 [Clavulina sp. PMI_390]|nr:hypothetical protein DL93DRAFT_2082430 [Clavulina sp. PMI_390]